ncbi:MAG: exosortase/archaeosortase family protein [Syntrophales bacterium]|nr:exosortase/archaeosortase family protein [Syntrophales bacterium]
MAQAKVYLFITAFFFAYYPVIYDLRDAVLTNELAHHAPLVMLLAGYLAYNRRDRIRELLASSLTKDKGYWILTGLGLNLMGQAGGIYYLSQLSIPITIYGSLSYLVGKGVAKFLLPVLLFLCLAFPIPGKVYISLVFPLKLFVTSVSGFLLSLIGFPVRVHGNVIELPTMALGVDDACSGLSSLMAMVTLAFFCGLYLLKTWVSRLIMLVVTVPAVILANIFRVTMSVILSWKWGTWVLDGTYHLLWGIFVFVVSVIILFFAMIGLTRWEKTGKGS